MRRGELQVAPDVAGLRRFIEGARVSQARKPDVSETMVEQVLSLLTPKEILAQKEFSLPEIMTPEKYRSFDALLFNRERIRKLQLVPVKTDGDRTDYHNRTSAEHARIIAGYFGEENIVLAQNLFPYFLPVDVEQYIIWLKEPKTEERVIAKFAAGCMRDFGLAPRQVILFERPLSTESKLVRGTVPEIRHVHFWFAGHNEIVAGYLEAARRSAQKFA